MKSELTYISGMIHKLCAKKAIAYTPEFDTFLYNSLRSRFKFDDDTFVEGITKIYRTRPNELEMAIEDAIFRYKNQHSVKR